MTNDAIKSAIDALQSRFGELCAERHITGKRILEDSLRHQEIQKAIDGCIAGAQALGGDIKRSTIPGLEVAATNTAYNAFVSARTNIATQVPQLKAVFGIGAEDVDDVEAEDGDARANMPRIADIIHERLKEAGPSGAKAADIRAHILRTYEADIHDKTVSMTLNRLQKEGSVRREGHVWFAAASEKPGAPDELIG